MFKLLCHCDGALLLGAVIGLLAACGAGGASLKVVSATDANQNSATALDIVCLYDSNAISLMPKNSSDWFGQKSQLHASLASGIDVLALQIPPARVVETHLPTRCSSALLIYAYADYLAQGGQARMQLSSSKNLEIRLGADSVLVVSP